MTMRICKEKPYPLGCYIDYDKSLVVRAVFSGSKNCGVTLYPDASAKVKEPLKIALDHDLKKGMIYSARIRDVANIDDYASYNYFEDDEYFCDPYAKQVLGLEKFGVYVPDCRISAKLDNKSKRDDSFDWENEENVFIPYEDSFVYLLNVRGFTKSPSSTVSASKRGTFSGIIEKIPYLKDLGVTTLELMPVYEMDEAENPYRKSKAGMGNIMRASSVYSKNGSLTDKADEKTKVNLWGYKKGFYFAPRASFCENPKNAENEFKCFVKTMHDNGIEVILQFYFEENESESLIIDALRYWRCNYHIDGFHLKGSGLPIKAIVSDPLFTDIKIWNEWFDYTDLCRDKNCKERFLADYNNAFLYNSRRFLKSDDNSVSDFMKAMIANSESHGVINYVADYEGFRLFDLVSYEHKHNEENGENNKDGTDNNLSWNCGIEGRTRKHDILSLRTKQIKNILTMLFFAQGTPMIFGGDEFGNSQGGNNNPYCQDNETGWVDWKAFDKNKEIYDYVKLLIRFRKEHSLLHEKMPFKLMDYAGCGYPDLSYHGKEAWRPDLTGYSHLLGMLFGGAYEKSDAKKRYIYVVFNMNWTCQELAIPKLPEGYEWELYSDTDERPVTVREKKTISHKKTDSFTETNTEADVFSELLYDRSVRIYMSKESEKKKNNKTTGRKRK
ncbi:MAG: hypothetical protein K6G10_12585 [Butyrivibrio sp.]|nr:hypothetical protein [Butyrivibrio sp.]